MLKRFIAEINNCNIQGIWEDQENEITKYEKNKDFKTM